MRSLYPLQNDIDGLKKYRLTGSDVHTDVFFFFSADASVSSSSLGSHTDYFLSSPGITKSGFSNSHSSIPSSWHTTSNVSIRSIPEPFFPPSSRLIFHGPGKLQRVASSCWVNPRSFLNNLILAAIFCTSIFFTLLFVSSTFSPWWDCTIERRLEYMSGCACQSSFRLWKLG